MAEQQTASAREPRPRIRQAIRLDATAGPSPLRAGSGSPARAELPNWFWGVTGCLAALGVGFVVMFVVGGRQAGRPLSGPPRHRAGPCHRPPTGPARPPGHGGGATGPPPPARPLAKGGPSRREGGPFPFPAAGAHPAASDEGGESAGDDSDEEPVPKARPSRARAAEESEESTDAHRGDSVPLRYPLVGAGRRPSRVLRGWSSVARPAPMPPSARVCGP